MESGMPARGQRQDKKKCSLKKEEKKKEGKSQQGARALFNEQQYPLMNVQTNKKKAKRK